MVTWSRRFQSTSKAYSRDRVARDAQRIVDEDIWDSDGADRLTSPNGGSRLPADALEQRRTSGVHFVGATEEPREPIARVELSAASAPSAASPPAEGALRRLWRRVRGWFSTARA